MSKEKRSSSREGHGRRQKEIEVRATPSNPRPRREEPDVLVVVGNTEFWHYRQILCRASDYFDAALNSGMKEAETMLIEFPDDDPCEWELFSSFLEPFSQATVTKSNVRTLVPWFHRFGITSMLHICDKIYVDSICAPSSRRGRRKYVDSHDASLKKVLDGYAFSTMFNLPVTQETARRELSQKIAHSPHLFGLGSITSLLCTMNMDDEGRHQIWEFSLRQYIPAELQSENRQTLIANELFPHLLYLAMQRNHQWQGNGMYYA